MTIKDRIESHPVVWWLSTLGGGFAAELGAYQLVLEISGSQTIARSEYQQFIAQQEELAETKKELAETEKELVALRQSRRVVAPPSTRPEPPAGLQGRTGPVADQRRTQPGSAEQSPNARPTKLRVVSAVADNRNEYSAAYDAMKRVDGNVESYWSTKPGAILGAAVTLHLDSPSTITRLRFMAPNLSPRHAQPKVLQVTFVGPSGGAVGTRLLTLRLVGRKDWDVHDLSPVLSQLSADAEETQAARA